MGLDKSAIETACASVRDETGFEDGAEVKTARLHAMLGLEPEPAREKGETDRAFLARARKHAMAAIGPVEKLRKRLLLVHKVDMQATGRGVYRIVPRRDQATRAVQSTIIAARRVLRGGVERAEHVDVSRLTTEEAHRRDAAMLTAKAYLGMLGGRTSASKLDEAREKAREKDSASTSSGMPAMRARE